MQYLTVIIYSEAFAIFVLIHVFACVFLFSYLELLYAFFTHVAPEVCCDKNLIAQFDPMLLCADVIGPFEPLEANRDIKATVSFFTFLLC